MQINSLKMRSLGKLTNITICSTQHLEHPHV